MYDETKDLKLPRMAEGARFENPPASETIVPDRIPSLRSQTLTGELETGEEPIKTDRTQ